MAVELTIDWTRCEARGVCLELVSDLLRADDWGYPVSRAADGSITVAAHALKDAKAAVHECPRMALRLRQSDRSETVS